MTRYQRAAQKAVADKLLGRTEPVLMFTVSCWADSAACAAGKKRELYGSLLDYCDVLPASWVTRWLTGNGPGFNSDSFFCAVPHDFDRNNQWKVANSPDDQAFR